MVVCLERGADLRTAQLMPLPLTVSCFSEIQIGFDFLVPADPGSPGQRAVKRVCVCVYSLHTITPHSFIPGLEPSFFPQILPTVAFLFFFRTDSRIPWTAYRYF